MEIIDDKTWGKIERSLTARETDKSKELERIDRIKDPGQSIYEGLWYSCHHFFDMGDYLQVVTGLEVISPNRLSEQYRNLNHWEFIRKIMDGYIKSGCYQSSLIDYGTFAKILFPNEYREHYLDNSDYRQVLLREIPGKEVKRWNEEWSIHAFSLSKLFWLIPSAITEKKVDESMWIKMLGSYQGKISSSPYRSVYLASAMRIISILTGFEFPDEERQEWTCKLFDYDYISHQQILDKWRGDYSEALLDSQINSRQIASMGADLKIVEAEKLVLTDAFNEIIMPQKSQAGRRIKIVGQDIPVTEQYPIYDSTLLDIPVGEIIRSWREHKGLKLTELASMSNIAKGYLSQIEHGKINMPGTAILISVAEALGISPWDIIHRISPTKS